MSELYYNSPLKTVIAGRDILKPEALSAIRSQLPEEEAYQLKFVVLALNDSQGQQAASDRLLYAEYLDRLSLLIFGGITSANIRELLDKVQGTRKLTVAATVTLPPSLGEESSPRFSVPKVKSRPVKPNSRRQAGSPAKLPLPEKEKDTRKVSVGKSEQAAAIPLTNGKTEASETAKAKGVSEQAGEIVLDLRPGTTVRNLDKRRPRVGVIKSIDKNVAQVQWGNGAIRKISSRRLSLKTKYTIG